MLSFLKSSLFKKYLMAITGIPLVLFIFVHMMGNLQMFAGPQAINSYAAMLQGLGPLLWVFRISLIICFVIHIYLSITLSSQNYLARKHHYKKIDTLVATLTSRTMIYTGLFIFTYLIFHIMHFTIQTVNPEFAHLVDAQGHHNVYRMLVLSFSYPSVTSIYLLATVLLGFHVHHGASSFFQTLGLNNTRYHKLTHLIGPIFSLIVVAGFSAVPLAVLFRWIY